MKFLYKIANSIRRTYWYIFRPHTKGVKCLIECDGEYLLIQTSYSGKYWTLAGGGVDRNETPEMAAIREVKEELGIVLTSAKQIGQYESALEYKRDTVHLFYSQVSSKDFNQNSGEVSDARWFSQSELPENRSRALKETLAILYVMKNLLQEINDLYGVKVHSPEKIEKGFLSENHVLTDGVKKYFLKKYRFDNAERISEIHAVKHHFAKGGVPVILPTSLVSGETFFMYEDGFYALFPFVDGKQFERGELTNDAIVSMGKMLGHIHLLGKDSTLPIQERFNFKLENKEKTFSKVDSILEAISKKESLDDFDRVALKNVELKKKLLLSNTLQREDLSLPSDHLIHGDYLDLNVFFGENDNVSHVFDFEKTGYAPRTFELYRSMMYGLLSGEVTDTDLQRARLYLDSYSSVYPLPVDEIKRGLQLFRLKSIHNFWVESEHYLLGNYRVDEFLYSDYSRIQYLSEHYDELENALIDKSGT
jgi:Ser/Thr protein kinase RdoA (MazF antagonist)/8-oxo-dGTP pyrophosphatase MutT (NUDIX family)